MSRLDLTDPAELREARAEIERLRQRCKEHEQFRHQHRDCDRLACDLRRLRWALNQIASWGEGTEVGSHFDEPNSARMAREALGFKPADQPSPVAEQIQYVATRNGRAVICGIPAESHNCDEMGCSSVEHVLYRVPHVSEETSSPALRWVTVPTSACAWSECTDPDDCARRGYCKDWLEIKEAADPAQPPAALTCEHGSRRDDRTNRPRNV